MGWSDMGVTDVLGGMGALKQASQGLALQDDLAPLWQESARRVACWRRRRSQLMCGMDEEQHGPLGGCTRRLLLCASERVCSL